MNKNQIQGKAKEVLGEIQQKVGKVLGNTNQQIKCHAKEVEGKIQKNVGHLQESVKVDNLPALKRRGFPL